MKSDPQPHHLLSHLAPEIHLAADQLLQEVLSYLHKLPAHPMTAALAQRVQAHLEDPQSQVIKDMEAKWVTTRAAERVERRGANRYTPAGLPVIEVRLAGAKVLVKSPAAAQFGKTAYGKDFRKRLGDELARGVEIALAPASCAWPEPPVNDVD